MRHTFDMKTIHYTEIVFYKAWSELKSECGRTVGGALWWFVDPLLSLLIYYISFGLILNRGGDGFVASLCIGIIFWRWFQGTVTRGAGSVIMEKPLISKVYVPKMIFPVIAVLVDGFKLLAMLVVLFSFLWLTGYPPTMTYLAMPVLLGIQFLFIAAVSGFFAALVPFMPDLRNMLNHGLHLMFFLSGIFFSVDQIQSEALRKVLMLNPMAGLLAAYRQVLMQNQWPDWPYMLQLGLANLAGVLGVGMLLRRFDRLYPKIII